MQLRCTYCQTMFAIGRDETLIALQTINDEKLEYYHAYCPKCRRANRVDRKKLERSMPNWKAELKKATKASEKEEREAK